MKKLYQILFLLFIIHCPLYVGNGQAWNVLIEQSDKLLNDDKFSEALAKAEQALKIAVDDKRGSKYKHAVTLGKIGEIYFSSGMYDKASEYFLTEKNIKSSILEMNTPSYVLTLNNLSSCYQYLGRYVEAEQFLREAGNISREFKGSDELLYSIVLHNLAKTYQTQGKYSDAENLYEKALEIKKNILGINNESYANSLFNLGLVYKALGNNIKAEKNFEQSFNIYKNFSGVNNRKTQSSGLQLAMISLARGNTNFADSILKYVKSSQLESSPDYASSLYDLALVQWTLKNYPEASDLLMRAKNPIERQFGKTSSIYASCLNLLGLIYWIEGNYDESYKYLSQVVILRELFYGENHPEYANSLLNLAGLLSDMKNYGLADKYFKKAMTINLDLINRYFPFLSDVEKARFYENLKIRFDMFNNYVLVRKDENPSLISLMYDFHIATKALLLNAAVKVRNEIEKSGDEYLIENYGKWKDFKDELIKLYNLSKEEQARTGKSIDSLENLVNHLEKDLSSHSLSFAGEYDKKKTSWIDIQNKLNTEEAAIEIIRFNQFSKGSAGKAYYVALVLTSETKTCPGIVVLDYGDELETSYISNYQNSINHQIQDNESYKYFWEKIEQKIRTKKKIYLSLDGVYNKININTLLRQDKSYIIDNYDIVLLSNTSELIKREITEPDYSHYAILFGNPDFKKSYITSDTSKIAEGKEKELTSDLKKFIITELPGTATEIDKIGNELKNKDWITEEYTGEKSTKKNLRLIKSPELLHIATHGYFLSDISSKKDNLFGIAIDKAVNDPLLRSGLLFTGAEYTINQKSFSQNQSDNGILTAYEVMNLDLSNTNLVVLSACETGLGDVMNGEGVYGLQRAFMIAGTKSVIMSLWRVNDRTTQELMARFYKNWLDGKPIRESLTLAQKAVKQQYPHPYFWGGFVLIGN